MAIVKMKRVSLLGLNSERDQILKVIQRMGNLEITDLDGDQDENEVRVSPQIIEELEGVEAQLTELQFAIDFLNRYGSNKGGLFSVPNEVSLEKLTEDLPDKQYISDVCKKCHDLDSQLNNLKTEQTRIVNAIPQFESWDDLKIPLEHIKDTKKTKILLGSVDKGNVQSFETYFNDNMELLFLERVGSSKDQINYLMIYHESASLDVEDALKQFSFSKATFGGITGTPSQNEQRLREDLKQIEKKRQSIDHDAREFLTALNDIELMYDAVSIDADRLRANNNISTTHSTFMLKGWIPESQTEHLVKKISNITPYYDIKFEDPAEDEVFPVAVNNPPIVQPFEVVTNLYSTPNSHELDPNAYMAPFYFVFFGMMLGDAAYGLILAILASYFTKKYKWQGDSKRLGQLIALGGISTFIWGALYGSWFGDAGTMLGIPPLWFNPLDEPVRMLILCFAMGIVQIFAGMAIKAYMNVRDGHPWAAVFDQGFWYVFLIGLIVFGLNKSNTESTAYTVGKYMSIAGAVGLILTQGREEKNIFKKLVKGILSLYDITGFLSDVLSYSRLFALGLATGVIGMVLNKMAAILGSSPIGWILAVFILVVGHLFNIAINTIGAYVHASRLQYIEFFGRFFEGGGHAFKPLSIKTKYTQINKEEAV